MDEQEQRILSMMREMVKLISPLLMDRLQAMQEDPEKRFVTVVGGEPLIDFERLVNAVVGTDGLE